MPTDPGAPAARGWRAAWSVYAHPRVAGMFFLGFSSGLPFLLVFSTMSAWLALADVSVRDIGYFSWVGLAYSLKFFWAPIVDRLPVPGVTHVLGRRRGWLLVSQLGVAIGLAAIAGADPAANLGHVAWLAIGVAFASATQDICVDAWRIEAVGMARQGAMAAVYQFGYRLAMLAAGAGAMVVAARWSWYWAYMSMAALMAVGVVTTLLIPEPDTRGTRAAWREEARVVAFLERNAHWRPAAKELTAWLIGAVVCPFTDFFRRNPWLVAVLILAFICTYRLSYFTKGVMANPFYLELGFSLQQIAAISKVFGVVMTMVGAAVGGWMVARYGLLKTLLIGLVMIAVAGLYFAAMTVLPHQPWSLALAITIDNFGSGVEGTAFIAYLSSLTNVAYTATQYALFSSLWSLPGKIIDGFSGALVDFMGYEMFFLYSTALSIPALVLLWALMRRELRAAAGPAGAAPHA